MVANWLLIMGDISGLIQNMATRTLPSMKTYTNPSSGGTHCSVKFCHKHSEKVTRMAVCNLFRPQTQNYDRMQVHSRYRDLFILDKEASVCKYMYTLLPLPSGDCAHVTNADFAEQEYNIFGDGNWRIVCIWRKSLSLDD